MQVVSIPPPAAAIGHRRIWHCGQYRWNFRGSGVARHWPSSTRGDALVIYAIGFGPTTPSVPTGAAAPAEEPLARATTSFKVLFGNRLLGAAIQADPSYVGLTPNLVGLYQINVIVPPGTAANDVLPLNVIFGTGGDVSNQVRIAVE